MEKEPQFEDVELTKAERIKKLVVLFETGLDSNDCIGYHGTSLEAVEFMIENGHLPGGKFEHIDSMENWLYFSPKYPMRSDYKEKASNPIEEAKGYAGYIAGSHFLLRELGLDIDNQEFENKARNLVADTPNDMFNDPEAEHRFFQKMGINRESLDLLIKKARKRKGLVLGLSEERMSFQIILPGDAGGEDMRVHIPDGLGVDFLSGLEPVGDEEWEYFEKLQEQNKS